MILRTTITVGTLIGSAAYLFRRRFSRKWIDCRSQACDLTGKTIVITGGNAGLGYEAAKDLVRRNATVVLACRNIQKAQEAAKSMGTTSSVQVLQLDLASLDSVRQFCNAVAKEHPSIHALICNAGVWVPMDQEMKTKDGFEIHFGVNHLGHFALIQQLKDCVSSRIVIVSSSLLHKGKLDLVKKDFVRQGRRGETKAFAPTGYCDSKLMNALTAKHLSHILKLSTVAVCPGFCRSSLGRHVRIAWYKKILVVPIMRLFQRSATQGAQNIVHAVIEPELKSGAIYRDGEVAKKETDYAESLGEDVPRQLWELSEQLVKETMNGK